MKKIKAGTFFPDYSGPIIPAEVLLCGVDWKQGDKSVFTYEEASKTPLILSEVQFFGDLQAVATNNPHVKFVVEKSFEPYNWLRQNLICDLPNIFVLDQRNVNHGVRELGYPGKVLGVAGDKIESRVIFTLAKANTVQITRPTPIDIAARLKSETPEQKFNRLRRDSTSKRDMKKITEKEFTNPGVSPDNFPLYVFIAQFIAAAGGDRDDFEVRIGSTDGAPRSLGRATINREINTNTKKILGIKKLPQGIHRWSRSSKWALTRLQERRKFKKMLRDIFRFVKAGTTFPAKTGTFIPASTSLVGTDFPE